MTNMDGRPLKRQRRSEGQSSQPDSKPVTLSSRPKPTRARPSPTPSSRPPSSSPSPTKTSTTKTKPQSKSLHNFFQPATEGQRWSAQKSEPKRPALAQEVTLDADEIEDDYDSYDEIFTQHIASQKTETAATQPPIKPAPTKPKAASRKAQPSKRFLIASGSDRSRQSTPNGPEEPDRRPWAQRFAPADLDELAVHKRKVSDVQKWLEEAFSGRRKERLLVLRGPSGSGKTTTLSMLSENLGFEIIEWKNPSAPDYTTRGYVSISAQFEEFLGRGDRYGGLEFTHASGSNFNRSGPSQGERVLLVEEFPTVLNRNSSSLAAFRTSLQRYLAAAAAPNGDAHPPVVMIVSETLLSSTSSVSDNLTVHRLLGPTLYNHPGTSIIDFNSIAPTFMQKALRLVMEKEARVSQRSSVPGQAVFDAICDIGDIRSAISSLEFLCLKGDNWGGKLTKGNSKKSRSSALTPMEEESLRMISQREASLGMFHAVGKIVYNKRMDRSLLPVGASIPPAPPDYFPHYDRPKVSEVAVNELMDESGTDTGTFICALHENYPPSCHGSSFTDSLNFCIDALSDSDILSPDRRSINGSRAGVGLGIAAMPLNAGVDILRQDEFSFQVAARGLLFGLPYPVNRRLTGGGSHSKDAFKMLYPTSLRLWRQTEEIDGLVDDWMKQSLDPFGASHLSQDPNASGVSGVASWKNVRFGHSASSGPDGHPHGPTVTMISRSDALLYQLPYMARIQSQDSSSPLAQITQIAGSHLEDVEGDELATEPRNKPAVPSNDTTFGPRLPLEEEKLILSDDDIVDD